MKNTISTKKEFIKNSHLSEKLINSVVSQFGGWEIFKELAENVTNYGIDGGFSGFIYYSDTHQFAIKNRALIVKQLEEDANSFGEDVVSMVSNFGVFRPQSNSRYTETGRMGIESTIDADDRKDLYKYLGGGRPEQGTITNVMAWFAAEEVCRAYVYFIEEN